MQAGKIHRKWRSVLWIVTGALLLPSLFTACKSTRRLSEDEYLLKRNRVVFEDKSFDSDELKALIRQKPNRKTLFIWSMHLRFYNSGLGKNQDSWLKKWLRKIGEEPVIYEASEAESSANQLEKYLFQNGYFNAAVSDTLIYNHKQRKGFWSRALNPFRNKKKVITEYHVTLKEPYLVKKLDYVFLDERLQTAFKFLDKKALPEVVDDRYNYKILDQHRSVISTHFQNTGYFDFKPDYINYSVDTTIGDHEVALTARILNPVTTTETGEKQKLVHTRYTVGDIYVYPNHKLFSENNYQDTLIASKVNLVYNPPLRINPKLLPSKIFLDKDTDYRIDDARATYRNLNNMGLYKSINIDFESRTPQENNPSEILDTYIYLSPLKRHSLTFETRVESRAYTGQTDENQNVTNFNFGVSGNVSLSRINAFKNGETLKLSFSGGLEPFFLSDSSAADNFFNTVEFGPSLQLTFPRFLLPISQSKFPKSNRPQTTFSISYNLLRNDDFFRRATKVGFNYSWLESEEKFHRVAPIELSFVDASLSGSLQARLDALNNPFLNNTYSDQIILASNYTFTYRKPTDGSQTNGWYNRAKIEGAGNSLRAIAVSLNSRHKPSDSYQFAGVTFAQYLSLENDFRYYRENLFNQTLAVRLYTAFAKPFNNLNALPFEKSYFAGGSNGIRAWRARELGPGSFLDTTSFSGFLNRIGEIRIETSAEYRFDIISFVEGALFMDAGNIWVFEENADREGTEFDEEFYKDLALGAGFGLRLDFDFFIIRFDLGFPLRDPALPRGEKWFYQDKEEYNALVARFNQRNELTGANAVSRYRETPNFNIGIGYPF